MKKIDQKFAIQVPHSIFINSKNWKIEKDGKYYICPSDSWHMENGIFYYEEDGELVCLADPAYYFSDTIGKQVTLVDIAEMM